MSADMSPPSHYLFTPTQDWFTGNIDSWRALFKYVDSPEPRILEIGTWEGRSAVFLLTELIKGHGSLTTVDHFDLMQTPEGRARREKVDHNLSLTGGQFRVIAEYSVPGLMLLLQEEMAKRDAGFDWIYVDGSHRADDTMLDGELAWRLAKQGAVVIFDDYCWDVEESGGPKHPKRGVDAFLNLHKDEFERLSKEGDYQLVIRKLIPMRIGFLTKDIAQTQDEGDLSDALEYPINLAFVANHKYAMPMSVAMCSAIKHVTMRCRVYIYDCGLSSEDKQKLDQSLRDVVGGKDVTHVFLKQTTTDLSYELGPVWGKIDLIGRLPVERALYLDADVLVREDISPLWSIDLQGNSLGAAVDAGFPDGHDDVGKGNQYFNAGVLLIDLAKARERLEDLLRTARATTEMAFKDQDSLNIHFAGDWMAIETGFNAQGQGTYAKSDHVCPNATIVHFTGPVSPSTSIVLNPWVQPYTSKPWGYAGAPGNPYTAEWWASLEQTSWKGVRGTESYKAKLKLEKEMVVAQDMEKLALVLSEAGPCSL